MRFFDVGQPFALRRPAIKLNDVDRALAGDLDTASMGQFSWKTRVRRRHEALAVQAPGVCCLDTTSFSTTSSLTQHDHPPSSDSSSLSSETRYTSYGLHRALNSLTISQTHVHFASKKAQKNLRYLDDMRATHDQMRNELDSAIDEYQEVFHLRDANDDPKLEGTMNRQFLSANNRLARASREYTAYVDDLNELRQLPELSRATLKSASMDWKVASKLDRQDEQHVSMYTKLREVQEQTQELEHMRHDLIDLTNPIGGLTQQLDGLEIERDNLKAERGRLKVELNTLHAERNDLQKERDSLRDDLSFKTEWAINLQQEQEILQKEHEGLQKEQESLQKDVSFKTEWAIDLTKHLNEAVARSQSLDVEVNSYKSQLSFAKAETTRYKDENKSLRRENQDLGYNLAGAQDEIDTLRNANEDLRRNTAHLRSEFEEVHGQARTLQRRFSDVTSSGRRSLMEPVPFVGGTAASIQETLEESQMRERVMSMGEKAMSF
ncbi:hypothetical protein DOTSEDRAFT_49975 [Dothistroma septosporum NZE10]|uniref:Uncharacterized protein n=1 Tax=Dothistroma septosporum (strain NZE10 / CBS 128990) TaxID=675120 RepID=N1Q260_DOTSN|nr:hypothetical protein DOTSEDRAFT_49975 [Dothistroma septosporum NZE10]